jgi:hypothetical protein
MAGQTFNVGDPVHILSAAHLPREVVTSTGTIERITRQTSDGTPLYWVSGRRTAVTAVQLRSPERTITYTVSVTVTRPVRVGDADETLNDVATWMVSQKAKTELEREILRALKKLDGDCDCEVLEVR